MLDSQLSAVEEYLAVLRRLRAETINTSYRDEVMMDLRRSAKAAADALTAGGSPHAAPLREFIDATEREDGILRAKQIADKALGVGKALGTVTGHKPLADLAWPILIAGALVGLVVGFLLVAATAAGLVAGLVAAVPIGLLLSRGSMVVSDVGKRFGGYMQTPDPARALVNSQLVPAERKFFAVVPGRPPVIRASTVSAAGQKSIVTGLVVAVGVGLVVGLLAGASAKS